MSLPVFSDILFRPSKTETILIHVCVQSCITVTIEILLVLSSKKNMPLCPILSVNTKHEFVFSLTLSQGES